MSRTTVALDLLETAEKARVEYNRLSDLAKTLYFNEGDCYHPPLAKSGKHDKRFHCDVCAAQAEAYQREADPLCWQWQGVWDWMDNDPYHRDLA